MALKISEVILFGTLTGLMIMLILSAKKIEEPEQRSTIIIEEVD